MPASTAATLYTPEMLALAVELANYPPLGSAVSGEAVSRTCGSRVAVDVCLSDTAKIESVGLRVSACAVGQAAAAIFARGAHGKSRDHIVDAEGELAAWLEGGALPQWPGIAVIAPAQAHPGRHGAILLPWRAACEALSKETQSG